MTTTSGSKSWPLPAGVYVSEQMEGEWKFTGQSDGKGRHTGLKLRSANYRDGVPALWNIGTLDNSGELHSFKDCTVPCIEECIAYSFCGEFEHGKRNGLGVLKRDYGAMDRHSTLEIRGMWKDGELLSPVTVNQLGFGAYDGRVTIYIESPGKYVDHVKVLICETGAILVCGVYSTNAIESFRSRKDSFLEPTGNCLMFTDRGITDFYLTANGEMRDIGHYHGDDAETYTRHQMSIYPYFPDANLRPVKERKIGCRLRIAPGSMLDSTDLYAREVACYYGKRKTLSSLRSLVRDPVEKMSDVNVVTV